MLLNGYTLKSNDSNAVSGSLEIAKNIFEKTDESALIHFCSSRFKDSVQLRMRLIRKAYINRRSFDSITEEGTIIYSRIFVKNEFFDKFIEYVKNTDLFDSGFETLNLFSETIPGITPHDYTAIDSGIDSGEMLFDLISKHKSISCKSISCKSNKSLSNKSLSNKSSSNDSLSKTDSIISLFIDNIVICLQEQYPHDSGFIVDVMPIYNPFFKPIDRLDDKNP